MSIIDSTTNLKATPPNKVFWPVQSYKPRYWLFWAYVQGKYKGLSQCKSVSLVWIFLLTSSLLWFLQRGRKEWRNSNRMRTGWWCSCGCVSCHFIWVEKSVVKLQPFEAAIQGWYEKKNIRKVWNENIFPFKSRNFS